MNMKPLIYYLLLLILALPLQAQEDISISLYGTSGLFNIATANILPDGVVVAGMSYIPKPYGLYGKSEYDEKAYYIALGYLPFLELDLKITRQVNYKNFLKSIGDRMASFRMRCIKEGKYNPALAFGMQDVAPVYGGKNAQYFNAVYVVSSKSLPVFMGGHANIHLGYGFNWHEAKRHQLLGVFGGMEYIPWHVIRLIVENDCKRWQSGVRITLFSHLQFSGTTSNFKKFSGNINLFFDLKPK
jgi:hypothetical protein